jgi:glyoxylase-like metal-dependent hydrolase (beta-lactamase superfamily II)
MRRMGKGRRRVLIAALAVVLVPPVLAVVVLKVRRDAASKPAVVRGGVMHVRNLFTDLYGVRAGDKVLLFDAGVSEEGGALDALLGALKADRDAVSDVFLSHGHFDHVAAAPLCRHARIRVGAADVDLLAGKVSAKRIGSRWFNAVLPVAPIRATDPIPGGAQEFPIEGGGTVVALPFPGHTPGSYLMLHDGVLFAGDSLQIDGDRFELAMAPFTDDPDLNRRSVAGLTALLAGRKVEGVCTGHQGCTPDGKAGPMLAELTARLAAPR